MEERYEIRGKLGQGGLGAVYRAWDRSLKREVAIKRILAGEDVEQREEATRQLEKETGALAAMQHPNIVTIYDVGSDEDGPFVVMELISGETLDEIVTRAPLTWADFRELVMQIQEALIAAQDLGLLHRDLKPSNLMLNWLPSGRFQAKIVDFGLAKFSAGPSRQTIDQGDSIFGSIHYMAPEQFERAALDSRADMYAIGCVYYFALSGRPPFEGETGPQVMAAHLEHRVIPLGRLRPDLPSWVVDWVMWHMNRHPGERPENARESLKSFIQLDVPSTQAMSTSENPVPEAPKRPRLVIPGAAPVSVPEVVVEEPVAVPQPLAPPAGAPPSVHTAAHGPVEVVEAAPEAPEPAPAVVQPVIAPKLVVAESAKPAASGPILSPQRAAVAVRPAATATATAVAGVRPTVTEVPGVAVKKGKKGAGSSGSNQGKMILALVLGIVVILLGYGFMKHLSSRKRTQEYNEVLKRAADVSSTVVTVNRRELDMLLAQAVLPGANVNRETIYRGLRYAESTDGTDVDAELVRAATVKLMDPSIRSALLTRVIAPRKSEAQTSALVKFAKETTEPAAARDALSAVVKMGGDAYFSEVLEILRATGNREVREAAEKAAASILSEGARASFYAQELLDSYKGVTLPEVKLAFLRLMGRTGDDEVAALFKELVASGSGLEKLNAVLAMQYWPDAKMFPTMMEVVSTTTDLTLRKSTFEGAMRWLVESESGEDLWKSLVAEAKTSAEQMLVIQSLASRQTSDWAIAMVEEMAKDPDAEDEVIDRAEKAVRHMKERAKISGGGK